MTTTRRHHGEIRPAGGWLHRTARLRGGGAVAAIGVIATVLTAAGLSGVGDAPAPNDTAASMAEHFEASASSIFAAAPLGVLGVVAIGLLLSTLAGMLRRAAQPAAATAMSVGGFGIAGYLVLLHVVYTTLAYTTGTAPDTTKTLFVLTIVAAPTFGLAVAVTLGAAAVGALRARLLSGWWVAASGAGALASSVAVFSYDRSGYFSPDVQQQIVGNIVLVWLLATTWALTTTKGPSRVI